MTMTEPASPATLLSPAVLFAACEAMAALIRREYGDGPIAPDVATFTEATPVQLAAVEALDAYWLAAGGGA